MESLRILFLLCLVVIGLYNEVSALGIVSPNLFEQGDDVTVTCSADAVELGMANLDNIYRIQLSRQKYSSFSNTPEDLFIVDNLDLVLSGESNYLTQNTFGSNWKFSFPSVADLTSETQKFSRNVLKGVLTMEKATCEDAGHYICQVTYKDVVSGNILTVEEREELNSTVSPSNMGRRIVPDFDADQDGEAEYNANFTIEMTCTANGPEDYRFFWKERCPDPFLSFERFLPYQVQNDIKEHIKTAGDCGAYRHSQMLRFDMSANMDDCMLRCDFGPGDSLSENLLANFTFHLIKEDTTDPSTGASASSASNDDLVIGLTVSLLLVAIIVVAVLLYVCWWRKRTPSQDKYKDEPDVGHNANHAPPPVFYSKPNKPPKNDIDNVEDGGTTNKGLDHSYDSRDSGTGRPRGGPGSKAGDEDGVDYVPPRYVNHQEPFSSGPPTYNSHDEPPYNPHNPHYDQPPYGGDDDLHQPPDEDATLPRSRQPYMGHQNTAYDGGDPQPEGRKYSRGRARSNRSDRLNSSRSTEDDGSVVHGLGDVNMGTAI